MTRSSAVRSPGAGPRTSAPVGGLDLERGPHLTPQQLADRHWAVFITTYARPSVVLHTLETVLNQTYVPSVVLVVDNSPDDIARANEDAVRTVGDERVVHVATGDNLGSAGGTAFGLAWLAQRGFEWITSVDDDDPPSTPDSLERLRALAARHPTDDVGILGAVGTRWDWGRGEQVRLPDSALAGDLDVDVVGGSSLLTVRRAVIEAIGPPNPQFFFGYYDPLYCLQARQAGFRILVDGDLLRANREAAGRMALERRRALVPRDAASGVWRRYYVTRNYIFAMRRTLGRPDLARRESVKAMLRSVTAFGRGPRFGTAYARLQLRGVVDGYRGRLGRQVPPAEKTTRDG